MGKVVCIHQPEHLPWAGLIHKISISNTFIVLDNVQFKKNYFENRNKIYTQQGWQWLTIPVKMQGHIERKFYEMEMIPNWKKKYLPTLYFAYKKAPYFSDLENILKLIEDYSDFNLADFNILLIKQILADLNIETEVIRAKGLNSSGQKSELLISLLNEVGATEYIVGKSGFDYMDLGLFEENGIKLTAHKFSHPVYSPFNYQEMTDFPSILDVIANMGLSKVKEIIK